MKILIISLAGIGNTLLATSMIKLLRKNFPKAYIVALVMFKGSKEILETNPNLDEIIAWDFLKKGTVRSLRFLLNLRKKRFNLAILTYPANRIEYNLISFIIGAKIRIAHKYNHLFGQNFGFLNNKIIKEDDEKHDVEENVRLLYTLGIKPETWDKPRIYLTNGDKEFATKWLKDRYLEDKTLVGFHPGTAQFKNQTKRRWDGEKFGELGKKLTAKQNINILIFGGKDEKTLKTYIKDAIGEKAYIVSNTTMRETAALMSHCALFVSADSCLMHTAAALNISCIAIFGPTNVKWVYPYKTKYRTIRKPLPCSPCFYYSQRPLSCQYEDFRCIRSVTVEEVLTACLELLKSS